MTHPNAEPADAQSVKQRILDKISDMVSDLIYYDRVNDEDLPISSIEWAISDGNITVAEMVEMFRTELTSACSQERAPIYNDEIPHR